MPQNLEGYSIGEDEKISYEITVHGKRYQAAYYQFSDADADTTGMYNWALNRINEYGREKFENMSEEEMTQTWLALGLEYLEEKISHKSVWFMINELYGKYGIIIFYDNELNQANGEDL